MSMKGSGMDAMSRTYDFVKEVLGSHATDRRSLAPRATGQGALADLNV